MWFLWLFFLAELAQIKTQTIKSLDKELQNIQENLTRSQNEVVRVLSAAEVDVSLSIADFKGIKGTANASWELKIAKEYLNAVKTYLGASFNGRNQILSSCNDLNVQIYLIGHNMNKCLKIRSEIDFINQQINNKSLKVFRAFTQSKKLTESAESQIDLATSSFDDVATKLEIFSEIILEQSTKYNDLQAELKRYQKNCICPSQKFVNIITSQNIDKQIKQIQRSVELSEIKVQNISAENSFKIGTFFSDTKKNSSMEIVKILEFFREFFDENKNLTTSMTIDASMTCDSYAETIAILISRIDFYARFEIEARNNVSLALFFLKPLEEYYNKIFGSTEINFLSFIAMVIKSVCNYVEIGRQCILTLSASRIKFEEVLNEITKIKNTNCSCVQSSSKGEASTTVLTTKFVEKVTTKATTKPVNKVTTITSVVTKTNQKTTVTVATKPTTKLSTTRRTKPTTTKAITTIHSETTARKGADINLITL
jgi:hypothetical protein